MSNTYTKIHIQVVFAVKWRTAMIEEDWRLELYQYITGTLQSYGHKMLAINGMPDHLHLFLGMRPTQSLSDLMQDVKSGSSGWINAKGFCRRKFEWQSGFGGFSYARSQVDDVVKYIANQQVHHQKQSFLEEYKSFLQKFDVDFEEQYIFREPE